MQYDGVVAEHRTVRTDCGVFDVSHMGEIEVEGPRAARCCRGCSRTTSARSRPGEAQYTLLTNERGGIVDDLIVYRLDAVPNTCSSSTRRTARATSPGSRSASRAAPTRATPPTSTRCSPSRGRARSSGSGSPEAPAFTFAMGELDGVECMVARTGYTGEPGVELIVHADDAAALWDAVARARRRPCGLGARDTLRLEVCYPLHGNDITPETDAISAGLGWVVRARQGVHGRRASSARIKEEGPARQARAVRDGGQGGPAPGHADRGRRRGHLRARTRRCSTAGSAWATCRPRAPSPGPTHDRRARQARAAPTSCTSRSTSERSEHVAAAESYPDDLRYHPEHDWARDRRRRGDARHHLVRGGRARRARPLRAAGGRRDDHEGRVLRRGRVGQGRLRRDRAALGRGRSRSTRRSSTRRRP